MHLPTVSYTTVPKTYTISTYSNIFFSKFLTFSQLTMTSSLFAPNNFSALCKSSIKHLPLSVRIICRLGIKSFDRYDTNFCQSFKSLNDAEGDLVSIGTLPLECSKNTLIISLGYLEALLALMNDSRRASTSLSAVIIGLSYMLKFICSTVGPTMYIIWEASRKASSAHTYGSPWDVLQMSPSNMMSKPYSERR